MRRASPYSRLISCNFRGDDFQYEFFRSKNLPEPANRGKNLLVFIGDLVALQASQPLQAHLQNGLGLNCRELELGDEPFSGLIRRSAAADERDDLVQVIEGLDQAFQDVGPLLGFAQLEARAADDDLFSVIDEVPQDRGQVHHLGLVVDDGQEVNAEGRLHSRIFEE